MSEGEAADGIAAALPGLVDKISPTASCRTWASSTRRSPAW